jgi:hypothetical protein
LEKARERKRKSKGKKRKRDDDAFSEEEIALQLEGWLTCERCVVSSHWVNPLLALGVVTDAVGLSERFTKEKGPGRIAAAGRPRRARL